MEFWMVRRKHHCRNCGQVFCNECTGQVARIPSQNLITAERVCLPCYKVLTGKNSPSRESMTESSATIGGERSQELPAVNVKSVARDPSDHGVGGSALDDIPGNPPQPLLDDLEFD